MKTTANAIGQLKTKKTVYCSVCSQSLNRNVSVLIFNNTPEEISKAKIELDIKANAEYTCKICKSILKDVA